MPSKKVLVIGAGLSGLAAAALLARQGFQVRVLEKNGQPGGVAGCYRQDGYRFDRGPSWYLMPEVFETFFAQFGKSPADFFQLIKLDPSYKVFFSADESAEIAADMDRTCRLFDGWEQNGGEKLRRYLQQARSKYEIALKEFLYRDYRSLFDFFNKKMLIHGARLHLFQNLDGFVRRFFTDERARKLLEYNMVFLGCSPYKSPALYSIMSHVDLTLGVFYPRGGISKLAEALELLARQHGAEFTYNTAATGISVSGGTADAVLTDNGTCHPDIVLVSADYHHAETALLEPPYRTYPDTYWSDRLLAPSAFIIYLGVARKLPGLQHHNLYLAGNWREHFASIFDRPAWPENPSYYVACPSKTDPSVAPPGCENIFILVPTAPGLQDTDAVRERFAEKIIAHLEHLLGSPIADAVSVRTIFSQRDFRSHFNLYKGTAMGLAHTLRQTACFRPAHKSKKVANLYYTGHYTHPGIGLPMVLIASQIASETIQREHA